MKIVINRCFGGFSISKEACAYMANLGCERARKELEESEQKGRFYGYGYVEDMDDSYDRTSEYLVKAVEALGEKAHGSHARLVILEIPDNIDFYIADYDGQESVHENHRSW